MVQLCDLVAPLVLNLRMSMKKANLPGYILEIQNVLLNSTLIESVIYFSLACSATSRRGLDLMRYYFLVVESLFMKRNSTNVQREL